MIGRESFEYETTPGSSAGATLKPHCARCRARIHMQNHLENTRGAGRVLILDFEEVEDAMR